MAKTVYSDNQQNVDALAERLSGQTSLSAERAKLVAYDLLCRKALKIKSSALAQIFRSVDKECDTKAMRDELIAAKIVTKIEGSGINGRPAFYTINAEIHDAQEQPVEDSVEVPAAEEVAPREHIDTDELLDEHVVRAFTAKAGRGGFGGGGFGGGQHRPAQQRGSDLRLKVKLTLQEISTGVTKKFKVKRDVTCNHCHGTGAEDGSARETCPTCHGSGVVTRTTQSLFGMMQTQSVCPTCGGEGTVIKNKCHACGGTGVVKGEEVVEINIPAGVSEGMIVNVPGKGNAGRHNGTPGNIQVYIEEEPNDTFIRDDNDIIYNLLLDFPTAALGGSVEIPTIDGSRVRVKIEPGTQPGKALRLRNKGLPAVQGYGRGNGDMVVNISVYVPKTLSQKEKKALEEMRESDNFKGDSATKRTIFQKFRNYFS